MKITYRTKQKYGKGFHGTGIQVDYKDSELSNVEQLASKLIALGYKYSKSPFPIGWCRKDGMNQSAGFYKGGSKMFGMQTTNEHKKLLEESLPILKEYDATVTNVVHLYEEH